MHKHSRARGTGIGLATLIAVLALVGPSVALAADVTVEAIPGSGWIQSPDNNAAPAVIAESPENGLGNDSVKLEMEADSDFVGIARVIAAPLSDLEGGSWMTFVTGDSGQVNSEPASIRFGMNRLGTSEFTTMVVERVYNGTVTADTWQTTTLDDDTLVWQTNTTESFCLQDPFTLCTFAEFKEHYPQALLLGLTVAVGTGVPTTTSYVDGISFTADGETSTYDFELAAAPPTETDGGGGGPTVTVPPTDLVSPVTASPAIDTRTLVVMGVVLTAVILATSLLPARRKR